MKVIALNVSILAILTHIDPFFVPVKPKQELLITKAMRSIQLVTKVQKRLYGVNPVHKQNV